MTIYDPRWRRRLRLMARAGTAVSGVMLILSTVAALSTSSAASAVGVDNGAITVRDGASPDPVVLPAGSAIQFAMVPPSGAACPGSAAGTPSYRWQTFLVSDSVDVSTLEYATGPKPVAGAFTSPMYDVDGNPIVNKNPSASPLGLIAGIPTTSFNAFTPGFVPAGTYKLGFACTTAGATVSFWTVRITVTADAADLPAGFKWNLATTPAPTTTTSTTTTTIAPTTTTRVTTTTIAPTTTTRVTTTTSVATSTTLGAATSTTVGNTTTTAVTGSATTTSVAAAAGGGVSPTSPTTSPAFVASSGAGATLANTGSSPLPIVIWGILLLVFGRLAILLARPHRIRPPDSR